MNSIWYVWVQFDVWNWKRYIPKLHWNVTSLWHFFKTQPSLLFINNLKFDMNDLNIAWFSKRYHLVSLEAYQPKELWLENHFYANTALLLYFYQISIFLLGCLHFFLHFFFKFMENLFKKHPVPIWKILWTLIPEPALWGAWNVRF